MKSFGFEKIITMISHAPKYVYKIKTVIYSWELWIQLYQKDLYS